MPPALTSSRIWVFALTFLAYCSLHVVRKPTSVLKSVLHPGDAFDSTLNPGWSPFNQDLVPSRVAQAGYTVTGGAEDSHNGLYTCVKRDPHAVCLEFRNEFKIALKRVDGAVCRKWMDPGYEKGYCWVLGMNGRNVPPSYAQLHAGELPRPVPKGDPHEEEKAWVVRVGDVFVPDKKLRVVPHIDDGKVLLGSVDTVFLLAYTCGLFVSGYVADRVDIRVFLSLGMFGAGLSSIGLGLAHEFKIHSFSYFLIVSAFGGLAQSIGWPCVVAVMGRWFPRSYPSRGLLMGAWNSHISIGNILGSVITTASVHWGMGHENWPLGYEIPGFIVIACGVLVFLFLNPQPPKSLQVFDAAEASNHEDYSVVSTSSLNDSLLLEDGVRRRMDDNSNLSDAMTSPSHGDQAPGLLRAVMIPGVIPFALCLCFAKMGQYALLFWGPYYLQVVGFSSERAGYLCSFFDVGGLLGGIATGWLSDKTGGRRGLVACSFLCLAAPVLYMFYRVTWNSHADTATNIWMMIIAGFFVNGPVSLITTAVTADLGSHPSLKGDERLIASVAGIIDGTGSFGAALQGVLIGLISTSSCGIL